MRAHPHHAVTPCSSFPPPQFDYMYDAGAATITPASIAACVSCSENEHTLPLLLEDIVFEELFDITTHSKKRGGAPHKRPGVHRTCAGQGNWQDNKLRYTTQHYEELLSQIVRHHEPSPSSPQSAPRQHYSLHQAGPVQRLASGCPPCMLPATMG